MDSNKHLIITISRELGCGGAYIGRQIAKELNMYYADHEIITLAAEQLSAVEADVSMRDEKMESFWKSFWMYSGTLPDAYIPFQRQFQPTSHDVFHAEAKIIKHIAQEKPSVIIGRCGFYVLRDEPNRVSIFLHADKGFRIKRLAELYQIDEKEAEKMIANSDKERGEYISNFSGTSWQDARQFHLCIDTGKTGIDKSVELILNYVKSL